MKKFFALLKKAPKRTSAILAMVAAAIIVPAALHAYGPERATFTYENPAPYVTFDSITDNPNVGDERNFVRVRDNSGSASYDENVTAVPGHTYSVMVYYHNNAASNLNASGQGIAKDVALRMQMAANVAGNSSTKVTGFIDSSNANPTEVYDSANFDNTTGDAVDLSFVAGSAKVTSNGAVNGATLPDSVFTTGTKLGYDKLDGTLPGCNQYAGYVVFQVKATQANFTVNKQVRKVGETTWNKTEAVNPGDKVQYLVTYTNTGSETQKNVVLKDSLPKGETYVSGTTYVANQTNPQGLLLDAKSDTATTTGANIGNYAPTSNAYVMLTAQVAKNDDLPTCGTNTLTNTAEIQTDNGYKHDTATVTVNKTCKPPVQPTCTCKALTATLVSDSTYKFNGSAEATNGATITGYTLDFGDGSAKYTGSSVAGVTHTYPADGNTYTARLSVTVTINGSTQIITSDACTAKVTTKKPPVTPVYTCKDLSATLVSDSTYKFNGSAEASNGATITGYTLDFGDGTAVYQGAAIQGVTHTYAADGTTYTARLTALVSVNGKTTTVTSNDCAVKVTTKKPPVTPVYTCKDLTATLVSDSTYKFNGSAEASNGATITGYTLDFGDKSTSYTGTAVSDVAHTYAQTGDTYTARLTANVSVNGKTTTVTSDACTVQITAGQPPVTPPTTPNTPPELPHTGAGSAAASITGLGAIVLSLGYFIASRRAAMGR